MELNNRSSALGLLASRRSGRAQEMVAPGPSEAQLLELIAIASRVPDHGKLAPWRFIHIADRQAFAVLLQESYRREKTAQPADTESESIAQFARQAPTLLVAVSNPRLDSRIPVWEQQLAAAAATFQLHLVATAMGFVCAWLTGWAAYSPSVQAALGLADQDRVVGFMFIGTPSMAPVDRPRPSPDTVLSRWPAHASAPQ